MEQAGGVTLEESEATTSRRVANIMEELFRWTAVKLVDGEHTSDSTRSIRQYNDIVYGMNSGAIVMGRRVDMLVQSGKREVELSSMEIKKPITPPSLIVDQQCKNLRTNGAILSQLQRIGLNRQFDRVVAMDWVGTVGYLYLLVDINNVYFAYQIGVLILPKSCAELRNFDKTLKLLFAYQVKDFR
ncbi:hypothetical protein BJV82DRAFT_632136 [Fennellomyces sp. T-0311]|nr:hypothetical protein BJV82DRAFT_632136 [Fennellomyces sp. T-0311]